MGIESTPLPASFNGNIYIDYKNDRLVASDDDNVKRLVAGKLFDGSFGVLVSKDGIDVSEATGDQLVFNSGQNVFKIVKTGLVSFPSTPAATAGSQTSREVDVDTGVSATKPLIAFCFNYTVESSAIQLPYFATTPSTGFGGFIAYCFQVSPYVNVVTGTAHIDIQSTNYINSILPASTMKWYLLQETATSAS